MANFIKKTASKIAEAIDGGLLPELPVESSWAQLLGPEASVDPPVMKFPLNLEDKGRPMIRFTCIPSSGDEGNRSVYFPCPQGVSYADGGSYTTIDIGIIGTLAKIAATEGGVAEKANMAKDIALKKLRLLVLLVQQY